MANVTIVPPTPQVQTVAAAGGGQAQARATTNLSVGSLVSGTITGKDPSGNFLLNTTQGTLSLKSSTPLTYNSDVVVQIGGSGAGGTSARIISVNGESFAAFAAPEPEASDTISPSLQTQAAAAPTAPATTVIRAVIVSAPAAEQAISNTQTGNDNSQPAIGTNVLIRITSAPQATAQQASTGTTQPPLAGTGNQSSSSAVQAHAQLQQLAEDATPANVAKLVAPQPAGLQQNSPAQDATASQTPEEALATSLPASSSETIATPSSTLYATYTNQPGGSPPAATSSTSSTPSSAAPANTLQGQVTAANSDASTVTFQTPVGTITIKAEPSATPQLLAPGTNVSIELPANSALLSLLTGTPLSQVLLSSTPAPVSELAASWHTLTDIINLVGENNTPAATALLSRLPQLGANFVNSTASFIGLLTEGNVRKLLGDDIINTLQQNGRLDLIQKFTGEMSELSNAYMSPAAKETQGWQTLFLPFVYQDEVRQARIYVKRDPPKKGPKSKNSSHDTRFVVEVDLSELGPMQMDGLIRGKQQSTSFDLIIRSRIPFSSDDQMGMKEIYNNASELTGFKGSIAFHVAHDFPVKPLDEIHVDESRSITA